MKRENYVIVLLSVIIVILSGYIIYDKIISNNNTEIDDKIVKNYDLATAKSLIDKYYLNSDYLFGNLFTEGLTEDVKMSITLNNSDDLKLLYNCDTIYENDMNSYKDEFGNYYTKLNDTEEYIGICENSSEGYKYESVNNIYKKLFGSSINMPKKDISVFSMSVFDYNDKYDSFIKLYPQRGGEDPTIKIYDIIDAKIQDNKLTINAGYTVFEPSDNNLENYTSNIDNSKTYTLAELSDSSFPQSFIRKYFDKVDTYEFKFEEENNNYVLKSMIKK